MKRRTLLGTTLSALALSLMALSTASYSAETNTALPPNSSPLPSNTARSLRWSPKTWPMP